MEGRQAGRQSVSGLQTASLWSQAVCLSECGVRSQAGRQAVECGVSQSVSGVESVSQSPCVSVNLWSQAV